MISKAMIRFLSEFQFQISFAIFRIQTCDGIDQIFSQVPPTFWLVFCFFMIEIQAKTY